MIELFCGTAGVTACFKRCGFSNAIAVDKTRSSGSLASVISLDLTKLEDQELVLAMVRQSSSLRCLPGAALWDFECCKAYTVAR